MNRQDITQALKPQMKEIRERFMVRKLLLFGSAARDEAGSTSDVDLIVDFEGPATFDRYMGLRFYLEDLLGRKVDLITRAALRPAIKDAVEQEALHVA